MNKVILGDSKEKLKELADNSVDSVVTDPPYELGFMGKKWDSTGIAYDVELWKEVYRVLKPGGHLLSFGGTRTYHRMACAIEDAGFEIRDQIQWVYGSGFPKSSNISKAIDKKLGREREVIGQKVRGDVDKAKISGSTYAAASANKNNKSIFGYGIEEITKPASPEAQQYDGWGTALKPANEPIVLARKPLSEKTVASNVLKWGVGGLNIDGCRVGTEGSRTNSSKPKAERNGFVKGFVEGTETVIRDQGRWPANFIHDGSDEVLELFPEAKGWAGQNHNNFNPYGGNSLRSSNTTRSGFHKGFGDSGSAARFFYCAKTSKKERTCEGQIENKHPTVKPIALMSYLCRLITPPGGIVLDPFAGSGTTAIACMREGFNYILIELEEDSYNTCLDRINEEQ